MSPSGPRAPVDPASPSGPRGPIGPVAPSAPLAPVEPASPCTPSAPSGPRGPAGPISPSGPVPPISPAEPWGPRSPTDPKSPAGPVAPTTPGEPGRPGVPGVPGVTGRGVGRRVGRRRRAAEVRGEALAWVVGRGAQTPDVTPSLRQNPEAQRARVAEVQAQPFGRLSSWPHPDWARARPPPTKPARPAATAARPWTADRRGAAEPSVRAGVSKRRSSIGLLVLHTPKRSPAGGSASDVDTASDWRGTPRLQSPPSPGHPRFHSSL